jgi:hypothetical protein
MIAAPAGYFHRTLFSFLLWKQGHTSAITSAW